MKKVLICANPDLNLIDGSSIWAQTITMALAKTGKTQVHFLAKSSPERVELFGPLLRSKQIKIIDGTAEYYQLGKGVRRLQDQQMFEVATKLDDRNAYDVIVVRGYKIAKAFAQRPMLLAKCWVYLTDIPQKIELVSEKDRVQLRLIAHGASRILYQSQGFYSLWQALVPDAPMSKFSLYSPVIPDIPDYLPKISQRPFKAIYAGKFKSDWKTLEMAECWPSIKKNIPNAELVMIGDKIHDEKHPANYLQRMRQALENTEALHWLGALPREQVLEELKTARVGLSWRTDAMDNTLEYSTKILEYGGAGCATILNRNTLHESLLGADYPLFANSEEEFKQQLTRALLEPRVSQIAADRLRCLACQHTFSSRVALLVQWLTEIPIMKKTILVAGHDLKFFSFLQNKLQETGKYTFVIDKWQGHNKHDEENSKMLLEKADIIFCEWCLGNVKWYSHNKKTGQRLVARFHLQEKDLPYLGEANLENINHISYVSEWIKRAGTEVVQVDERKTSVIANLMNDKKFTPQKKMRDARYTIGIIGITPKRKRIDLALDTLELLLKKDSRYQLRIKGGHPFDYPWLMNRSIELKYYMDVMERINSSDALRYKVIFDPPGDDVNQWLTLVGFILSPSDFESFHLAVGEGMLTGCIPVVWNWDGAAKIWPEDSIVETATEAAHRIGILTDEQWQAQGKQARDYVMSRYGVDDIVTRWCAVLEQGGS